MRVNVEQELSRLRSFQRTTADYVFERLFGDGDAATSRFLIADEVGLGKTMVAAGVIARAIDHLQALGDDRVDVVYICSNTSIAAQNLRKLAPAGVEVEHHTKRLPLLAFDLSNRVQEPINLIALTPGTIATGSAGGTWVERAAMLRALQQLWGGRRLLGRGIGRIFAGRRIGPGIYASPEDRIRAEAKLRFDPLSTEALEIFGQQIDRANAARAERGEEDLDTALHRIALQYGRQEVVDSHTSAERGLLISEIREALAMTGATLLHPDIVVLDEFQRFRSILHGDPNSPESDYAADVARHMFTYEHEEFNRTTRILMLSATPYLMHTTPADSAVSGDHYSDFLSTYKFLAEGLPGVDPDVAVKELQTGLYDVRQALADAAEIGADTAHAAAKAVSERLLQVMVRTEKLAATPNRDGMLRTIFEDVSIPSAQALAQYLSAAQVAGHVSARLKMHSAAVIEYWKSAPYTLSYLGAHGYQLAEGLSELAGPQASFDTKLGSMLKNSPAVLPWEKIRHYRDVPAAHAGLDCLWRDYFDQARAERLLWLPPSLPYYAAGGDFETAAARDLTKRLIFSSWNVAPTAIATLTSYECERRLNAAAKAAKAPTYEYDAKQRSVQHLRFAQDAESMANLQFLLPTPVLAELGDPLAITKALRAEGVTPTLQSVLGRVRERIAAALASYVGGRERIARGAGSAAWYSLAPVLLEGDEWVEPNLFGDDPTDSDDENDTDQHSLLDEHLERLHELWQIALAGHDDLPPVPEDLEDVLALSSVAGPPSVCLRAFSRAIPDATTADLANAAATAASGFRTLFNSPRGNQVVNVFTGAGLMAPDAEFWRKALGYCAAGNLQAVLDEYATVLTENRGYARLEASKGLECLARDVKSVLQLRPPLYRPAVMSTDDDSPEARWRQIRMRGHFALRYGSESTEESAAQRSADIGLAFNSPFWPFVLASTSVGQEGLDFHLYSHAVTHWNLPTNPVDLEQREGRVHRYKSHAVRKNIARALDFPTGLGNPWLELFDSAEKARSTGDSDMIPYWVFSPADLGDDTAVIERHLPIAPYTRESSIIDSLLASVSMYRLAFGQPRQEEFLKYVLAEVDGALRDELASVRIDLAPPQRRLS